MMEVGNVDIFLEFFFFEKSPKPFFMFLTLKNSLTLYEKKTIRIHYFTHAPNLWHSEPFMLLSIFKDFIFYGYISFKRKVYIWLGHVLIKKCIFVWITRNSGNIFSFFPIECNTSTGLPQNCLERRCDFYFICEKTTTLFVLFHLSQKVSTFKLRTIGFIRFELHLQ